MAEHPQPLPSSSRGAHTVWIAVALLIGLLALLLAGYIAHTLRQQARAEVWPRVELQIGPDNDYLQLFNKGVGPALIERVLVRIHEKPVRTWPEALRELALGPVVDGVDYQANALFGLVLFPGENFVFLRSLQVGPMEVLSRALDTDDATISVCYCSTLGECWWAGYDPDNDKPGRRQVDACLAGGDTDFIE